MRGIQVDKRLSLRLNPSNKIKPLYCYISIMVNV